MYTHLLIFLLLSEQHRHVQRVHFWHLKSTDFLETRWEPPLFEAPGCHLAVAAVQDSSRSCCWSNQLQLEMTSKQICHNEGVKKEPKLDPPGGTTFDF